MATRTAPPTPRTARTSGTSTKASGAAPTPITAMPTAPRADDRPGYVMPVIHVHLSERMVNVGFWGTLAGVTALGVVDLPLAALIGGAVFVARHHARAA
jgi:hypothetical protein